MIDFTAAAARFEHELADVSLPPAVLIEREMRTPPAVGDIAAAVDAAVRSVDAPCGDVAIAVGSRGIAGIAQIVTALTASLRARGARPFIVPAMGSHGASTAEGQAGVLAHLGITEAATGAPVRATMETVRVGNTPEGVAVHLDALAYAADAIVVVNRVKAHTAFTGPVESGPSKMLAVGLGKAHGARSIHAGGWGTMARNVTAAAAVAIATGKVAFALAILENADERPCRIQAIPAAELLATEPALLEEAKSILARLPFDRIDVLAVDRVGKDVSGVGGDPYVTGRAASAFVRGGPDVTRLAYLAMTPDSDGNGNGVGLADVVTAELAARYDPLATYLNALTSTASVNARLPMVMPTKRLAVAAALRMCPAVEPERAVLVRILDTLHLKRVWLSRAALELLREPYTVLAAAASLSVDAGYEAARNAS